MIATVLLFFAQTASGGTVPSPGPIDPGQVIWDEPKPWERWKALQEADEKSESLGVGPHVLVISKGESFTRMDYKSGNACQKARDVVRRQVEPQRQREGVIFYSGVAAFCVPR